MNSCVKSIEDIGARRDQLIYGVSKFVHNVICYEQKEGKLTSLHSAINSEFVIGRDSLSSKDTIISCSWVNYTDKY